MVKNLLTGGMGFIGVYLARQLLNGGEDVILFDRRSELPQSASDLERKVKIVSGDITNWVHVVDAVISNNIDCIYHMAALLGKDCERSPATGFRVNVVGTMNILEAARMLGVKHVLFEGSTRTYGIDPPTIINDDTPQIPDNMYSTTKLCCERLGEQYHRQYELNFCAVRHAMVVGPGRQMNYFYGDWSGVIERTAQGKAYTVHSDPHKRRGYIYVKDAVRSLIDLKRANESRFRQRVYNTHGFTTTLTEVAATIKKHIPDAHITFDWDKSEEMRIANCGAIDIDNTAASEDFSYEPAYLLDEMVEDFIREVRAGRAG